MIPDIGRRGDLSHEGGEKRLSPELLEGPPLEQFLPEGHEVDRAICGIHVAHHPEGRPVVQVVEIVRAQGLQSYSQSLLFQETGAQDGALGPQVLRGHTVIELHGQRLHERRRNGQAPRTVTDSTISAATPEYSFRVKG